MARGRLSGAADYVEDTTTECGWTEDNGFECSGGSSQLVPGSKSYTYDKVGNRTDNGAVDGPANRLSALGGYTLTYDDDGNLTGKSKTGFTQTLVWNALGQLQSVTTNGQTVTFGYDGLGRRVRKTVGGVTTRFLWDGDDLYAVSGRGGQSHGGVRLLPRRRRAPQRAAGREHVYYAAELPGHVAGLFNASGLYDSYRYTPWGQEEGGAVASWNRLRFGAREWDAESGLYYVRNRYYDPQLRRFLSEDPIGLAGGINLYAYAGNNPVNVTDPFGLDPCTNEKTAVQDAAAGKCELELPGVSGGGGPYVFTPGKPGRGPSGYTPGSGGTPAGAPAAVPDPKPDWGACGMSAAGLALSAAGDATFFTGAGLAFKGARVYMAGRAGVASVRSGAVRHGRGALLRRSNLAMGGGRGMMSAGAADAGVGWVGGLQDNMLMMMSTGDDRLYTLIPGVGTYFALKDTARDCSSAIRASF